MKEYTFKPEDVNVESWSSEPKSKGNWSLEHTRKGIQVVHLPTDIVIQVESERSQHQNRAVAFDELDRILRCTRCGDGEVIDHLGDWAKCPDCK